MVPLFVGLQSFAVIIVLLTRLAETPSSKSSLLGFYAQVILCSPFTCHLIQHCVFVPPHALKPYLVRCFLLDGSRFKLVLRLLERLSTFVVVPRRPTYPWLGWE
jgi:hypothetical protein